MNSRKRTIGSVSNSNLQRQKEKNLFIVAIVLI